MKTRSMIRLSSVAAAMAMAFAAHAGDASLAWLASATTGQNAATGYNIRYGTVKGGPYANKKDAGNALTTTITGLTGGLNYCFVATAYNTAGESPFSNEVCALIPFPPANSAPLAPAAAPSVVVTP